MDKWERTIIGVIGLTLIIGIIAVKVNLTKFNIEINNSAWWLNVIYGGLLFSVIKWVIIGLIALFAYQKRQKIFDYIKKLGIIK